LVESNAILPRIVEDCRSKIAGKIIRLKDKISLTEFTALIGLQLLCGFAACTSPELKEVTRVASPDRHLDAVLVEVQMEQLGATVSTPYQVYVVPAGAKKFEHPIMKGAKFDGLRLIWKDLRILEIQYYKGQIFSFQNFWYISDPENSKAIVEIRLIPTSERSFEN
jgi:hypothetical protein